MKINIKASVAAALPFALLVQLRASDPTPWDSMTEASGAVTIKLKTGKTVKRTGKVVFTASDVSFSWPSLSVPRQQVKELVIRSPRPDCCQPLWTGVGLLLFDLAGIAESPSVPSIAEGILFLPVGLAAAAVTGPPLLVIESARRLFMKPTKLLYNVVP